MQGTKKFCTVITVILLIMLCLPRSVFAVQDNAFTLRVGYWLGYGISQDESGHLSGYTYDYLNKIAAINHWQVEFVACSWESGLTKLANGEIDVFGPLQKTAEREKIFDYPQLRMGDEFGVLCVREDNQNIFYDDPLSMNGKILITTSDNYYQKDINEYCMQHHISLQRKVADDAHNFATALADGQGDLQVASSMLLPNHTKVALRFLAQDFYYPTTKNNHLVLAGLNAALTEIKKENPYYNTELYHKYYGQSASGHNAFTVEEFTYLSNAPVLKIGYVADREPFKYEDKQVIQGIIPDMIERIAQDSGLQFQWVKVKTVAEGMAKMQNGTLDMVSGIVKNADFARANNIVQTLPLVNTQLMFILKQGANVDSSHMMLAIPDDWLGVQFKMMQNYPLAQIKSYTTMEQCLDAVLRGDVMATVENALAADITLKPYKYRQLSVDQMSKGDFAVCLSLAAKTPPALLSVLDKVIGSLNHDFVTESIYKHTISVPYKPSFVERLSSNLPLLISAAIILLVMIGLVLAGSRRKLNKLAYYDSLTGEMNLNKFKLETQKLINNSAGNYAVMIVDIDKFKSVNDLYGYTFGDKMIVLVAKVLRSCLPPGSLLCHGAADKFYMFFDHNSQAWLIEEFEVIAKSVDEAVTREMPACKIVLSVGFCVVLPEDDNIIMIIDRANIAGKQVKSYHASSFAFYDPLMYDTINRAKTIENEMSAALNNGEFIVYLQPKIALATRKIAGAEALVRWLHPEKGLIAPNAFIPLFEENGFIIPLDYYMFEQVCRLLERWKREGRPLFTVSVNLSRRHLQNAGTAKILAEIVARYDVNPCLIEVELTESAFNNSSLPAITALFAQLHGCGFTVSVDDFGSGYSSLSLLKDLPIDVLKIDKSFFDQQYCDDDKMGILLESVISLSRKLNIKTLSEGVENVQQINLLVQLGCDLVQGFYFAKPMPIADFDMLLQVGEFFGKATNGEGVYGNEG